MTEAEWLRCNDSMTMLQETSNGRTTRKWNLILCGFCRIDWSLLKDERSRTAVETAERFEDGQASREELNAAHEAAQFAAIALQGKEPLEVIRAAGKAHRAVERPCVIGRPVNLAEDRKRRAVVCDILGPLPFRTVEIEPAWRQPEVLELARQIYDERAFERMPELADALEQAGCHQEDLVDHCRYEDEHWRGCWVLDLLLGKEFLARHTRPDQ